MRRIALVGALVCLASAGLSETIWSVGKRDSSASEFALANGGFGNFEKRFAAAAPFDVASLDVKNFPYVHPGPIDKWAGSKAHTLTLTFNQPRRDKGLYTLIINTLGAQEHFSPDVQVTINGNVAKITVPAGPERTLWDDKINKPLSHSIRIAPDLLREGKNEVALAVVGGSWLVYDSIEMQYDTNAQAVPEIASLADTPCFIEHNGKPAQIIAAKISSPSAGGEVTIRAKAGSDEVTSKTRFAFGPTTLMVPAPEVKQPTEIEVTMESSLGTTSSKVQLRPHRKWHIFVAPSIHTDIGYTHLQEEVFERHNKNLDKVREMIAARPDFVWNIEVAWEVQNYLAERPGKPGEELIDLMRQGRIGLHAGYLNMLTSLMSDEAMNRYIYYAGALHREHGIDISSAVLTDVPSAGWSVPSTLAASGVRCFAEGINQDRAFTYTKSGFRGPFYWEGPDGKRVMAWLAQGYAQSMGLATRDPEAQMRFVSAFVDPYDKPEYPFDAIYMYGAGLDNVEVNPEYHETIGAWNERFLYPKIVFARGEAFFDHVEKNFRDKIPVHRGDFGAYWEDGAGSTAQETAMDRRTQQRIVQAETLWSLGNLRGNDAASPTARFDSVWEDVMFYDEHTWGAAQSISSPADPSTVKQWEYKANYAHRAEKNSRQLLDEALKVYADTAGASNRICVANTLSWPRSGLVRLAEKVASLSDEKGNDFPLQAMDDGGTLAYVSDVAALGHGFISKKSGSGGDMVPPRVAVGDEVATKFYTVKIDPQRGIVGIRDAEGSELVDSSTTYSFGQMVYVSGGEESAIVSSTRGWPAPKVEEKTTFSGKSEDGFAQTTQTLIVSPARINDVRTVNGQLFTDVVVESSAPSMPTVVTTLRLHKHQKRFDVIVDIKGKKEILKKEAVYIAFPFAAKEPQFRLGLTNASADPTKDFLPGACHEWYCVQNFVSCVDGGGKSEVVMTPLDAPLLTISEINKGLWPTEARISNATLYSYIMNNYWHTNYKAGQGGDFRYEYCFTSGDGFTDEQRERFGRECAQPLLAVAGTGGASKAVEAPIQISGKAIATVLKPHGEGKGTVLRLRNTEGTTETAVINVGNRQLARCNLVEDEQKSMGVLNGKASFQLGPRETVTLLLK